ncbi:TIGR00269 family protein [Candidatus Woesearchaeota archaeon]|nr:TIGR00269 family protein [Candidatus Woesearchaeota archaeon]
MNCHLCQKNPTKAVIILQHGALCKSHFLHYFEERVFKTINKYRLIERNDRLCVAASGGKDSQTVLYLTKKYLENYKIPATLEALAIDEGIDGYREKTLVDLKQFCKKLNVPLTIVSFQEALGKPLDEAYPLVNKDTKKKPCNVCGVWRRYLLNKYAKQKGATKVVTGHNLDDEAQATIMNIFKAHTKLAGRLGPVSGTEELDTFAQRVKPLYFCPEKEVRLYALLKEFQIQFGECPYAREGFRHDIQEMLNTFEHKYPGTKQGIINSFLALMPLLKENKEKEDNQKIKVCNSCGEAANHEMCNACKIKEVLDAAK